MADANPIPFRQAYWHYAGRRRLIRLICIHCTQTPPGSGIAESIARQWSEPTSRKASAHVVVDDDSEIQCVHDDDTAWSASDANADGLHVEIPGFAEWTRAEWLEKGIKGIRRAAKIVARWAVAYDIPARFMTVAQVRDRSSRGLTTHATVETAFPSTNHTDPGVHFPYDVFLQLVTEAIEGEDPEDDMPLNDADKKWIVAAQRTVNRAENIALAQWLGGKPNGAYNETSVGVEEPLTDDELIARIDAEVG